MSAEAKYAPVVSSASRATGAGDAVLAPDAELHAFSGRDVIHVRGAARIARRAKLGARRSGLHPAVIRPITTRSAFGALIVIDGRPVTVMKSGVRDGLITEIRTINAPDRLAQIVPSWAL